VGRLDEARWQLHLADSAANEMALARAAVVGLIDMIDRLRFRDAEDPIPAPGIYELADAFERHTLEAMHATATSRILVDDLADAREADEEQAFDAVIDAVARTYAAAVNGGRALRHFVQIGFGITQHAVADDDAELLDRALIAVLNAHPMRTSTARDAFPLIGRTSCDLCVELTGAVGRMLCDQSSGTDPAPLLVLQAPGMSDVVIQVTEDNGVDLVDAAGRRSFPAPVPLTEVVSTALCTATEALGGNLDDLTPRWRPSPGEAVPAIA
jgi:hypothetical protein